VEVPTTPMAPPARDPLARLPGEGQAPLADGTVPPPPDPIRPPRRARDSTRSHPRPAGGRGDDAYAEPSTTIPVPGGSLRRGGGDAVPDAARGPSPPDHLRGVLGGGLRPRRRAPVLQSRPSGGGARPARAGTDASPPRQVRRGCGSSTTAPPSTTAVTWIGASRDSPSASAEGLEGSQGVSSFATRREYIPVGSGAASMPRTVATNDTPYDPRAPCPRPVEPDLRPRPWTATRRCARPVLEHTELFRRSIGEATDIVEKEMYTFDDRKGRSLSMRPEAPPVACARGRARLAHAAAMACAVVRRADVPLREDAKGALPPVPPARRRGVRLPGCGRRRGDDPAHGPACGACWV
jgi:hypothetical protein